MGFPGVGTEPGADASRGKRESETGNHKKKNGACEGSEKEGLTIMYNQTDIDGMWEANAMQEWEDIHNDLYEGRRYEAAAAIDAALNHLDQAMKMIQTAADEIEGIPEADKIISFDDDTLDLYTALKSLAEELRHGRR